MKFIHTADWQIGKPFARIADDAKRVLVQRARIEAIQSIGQIASDKGASFVVVAGDLFDSHTADKATVSAACGAIGQINFPVVVIPGNHDHAGPGCVWNQDFFIRERKQLARNLVLLLEPEPHVMDDVVIFPCPLLRKTEVSDSTAWLRDERVFQAHGSKPRIVLAHGGVHGFTTPHGDEESDASVSNHIDLSRLPLTEIDYIALGDWHGTKQISDKAWYAGTPEHDRFPKGGDHQPGHVLVVDVNRGGLPHVEQIATARLGWNELSFEFAGDDGPDHLQNELSNLLETRTGQDLLRLSLEGSLGIEAYSQMERILETWEARLLRLKLDNKTRIAPSEQEIAALTQRAADPVLSQVAADLVAMVQGGGEDAQVAAVALRELHGAISQGGAS